jgi:diacylglycerol O-acyltransferase / wax synthase
MSESAGTQLRGWDAATWRTASGDANLRSTVVAMAILDKNPDWPRLRARLERLTYFVPDLRKRPYFGATGFSAPRLALDPNFDIDVHVRRYRLPKGAGWNGLLQDARRMSLTDFDQSRPLWEAAVVEGLPGGQAAFLLKLHHSIADGQATVMIALALFELGEEPNPDEPPQPELPDAEDVSLRDITLANSLDNLRRGFELAAASAQTFTGLLRGTVTDALGTWSKVAETIASIGRFTQMPDAPLSSLMNGRGTTYTFAAFDLAFSDLRSAAKESDMSVNDAFMAAVGVGFDRYHRRHGVIVEELRVNVPISLRGDPGDRSGQASNAVSIARFPMPISGLSTFERMQAAHDLVAHWRNEPALRLANPLAEVSWFVPVPMLAHAAQASDITTSNVPGPPVPLYLAGARMVAAYPLVATIGAAVNITMVTYDGRAFIGVSTDDRAVPDLASLVEDLRAGFTEITGVPCGAADRYAVPKGAKGRK